MKQKNRPIRGKSIARRLNAALTRRSFAKTILIDILAAAVIMMTWCLTVENAHGGQLFNVRSRALTGECDIIYNTVQCGRDIVRYVNELRYGIRPEGELTLPFDGLSYTFEIVTGGYTDMTVTELPRMDVVDMTPETQPVTQSVPETEAETAQAEQIPPETEAIDTTDGTDTDEIEQEAAQPGFTVNGESVPVIEAGADVPFAFESAQVPPPQTEEEIIVISVPEVKKYTADASVILTLVTGAFLVLFVLQALSAILRSLSGGGLIKRYLRPIDDIAIMAEQLSRESHTATEQTVREDAAKEDSVLGTDDIQSLTDAIDHIADSRARLDMHAPELSGLEAAVNNMLKRLEEGRRRQIRFVDDASHELRTPIAVIQGYANMLDRWGKDDPKVRDEAIEAIKTESEHIKTLLDQLLFLARGEMDRHVLELKPLSVEELLCEIMEESQMVDRKHHYELTLPSHTRLPAPVNEQDEPEESEAADFHAQDVCILADAAMIKQSIRILCDNAVKYTPEGGTISLRAAERVSVDAKGAVTREVCIDVADTGCGISAEELPRIFDRFYRGENARADNTSGSGLGLSIARWIIEQHNGRIEAISSPGFGTKMTIILPGHMEE